MKTYLFTASKDGISIDFETVIISGSEPNFWELYELAQAHGCELFTCEGA